MYALLHCTHVWNNPMRIHVSSVPQSRRRKKLLLPKPSLKKGNFGGDSRDIYKDLPPYFKPQTSLFLQKARHSDRIQKLRHIATHLLYTHCHFNSIHLQIVGSRADRQVVQLMLQTRHLVPLQDVYNEWGEKEMQLTFIKFSTVMIVKNLH